MDIIKLLMENKKIDVNTNCSSYSRNVSPLFFAVENENIELIKLLLSNSLIDVNALNKTSSDRVFSERVKHQCKIVESNKTALYLAIEKENIEIIKLLLSNEKIDINVINKFKITSYKEKWKGRTSWSTWSFHNNEEKTAFYSAVEKENIEIIKLLLTKDEIDVNVLNKSELKIWKKKDDIEEYEIVEITAFYLAIEKENIEIINLILQNKNIDLNVLNIESTKESSSKKTALYKAVEKEDIDIIKLLLTNDNIDINKTINSSYKIKSDKWISKAFEKDEKEIDNKKFQCNLTNTIFE